MSTYIAITDSQLDPDAPLTSQLAYQWRDNPLAVFEGAASAPLALLPTVLLGIITTTSGATQSLSGLNLAPYKTLLFTLNTVSTNSSTSVLRLAGVDITGSILATGNAWFGHVLLDLSNGIATANTFKLSGSAGEFYGATTGYSNATTTVAFSVSAGTFDTGDIRVYGVK